jgi:post-segregation antitoxin (ccd killing protein)
MQRRKRQATTDLQIRGVPVTLRDQLRERAERRGVSMSRYLIELMEQDIPKMSMREWLDWVHRTVPPLNSTWSSADVLHEARREESPDQ